MTSCSFITSFATPRQVTKIFASCLYFKKSIIIIAQHVTLSVFYIGVFTLSNIYLSRSLTLPLHYNICRMENLGHEILSLCVLSKFSPYHGRICLSLVLLSLSQTSATKPHFIYFYTETPFHLPQKH